MGRCYFVKTGCSRAESPFHRQVVVDQKTNCCCAELRGSICPSHKFFDGTSHEAASKCRVWFSVHSYSSGYTLL